MSEYSRARELIALSKLLPRHIALGLLAVCWFTGCTSWPGLPASTTPTAMTELPPRETGDLCLATAQELEKNGFADEAIAQYEKARHCNPSISATVARHLALLYDRKNDAVHALVEYQAALKASPRDGALLYDYGCYQLHHHNWTQAEECLQRATAVDPDNQRLLFSLAVARAHQGRCREAYDGFNRLVGSAGAHYNLAVILAEDQNVDAARQELTLALQEQPDLKQALAFLQTLDKPQTGTSVSTAGYTVP